MSKDEWEREYDSGDWSFLHEAEEAARYGWLVERIDRCSARTSVLDVGCGAGLDCFVASSLAGVSGRVEGIDLTPEMASRAHHQLSASRSHAASVQVASAEHLPFPDRVFDVVTSNGALNLMPDKPAVFREVHRVLRKGGDFWFADVVRLQGPGEEHGDPDAWSR